MVMHCTGSSTLLLVPLTLCDIVNADHYITHVIAILCVNLSLHNTCTDICCVTTAPSQGINLHLSALFIFTANFVPGLISSTGVCQSMKQSARSFEDRARYIEIANYIKYIHKIAKSDH